MKEVEMGDTIQLTIEGKLENGKVFFKTNEDASTFVLGDHQIFPALEEHLVGMKIGETKTVTLDPKDAYGEHSEDLQMTVSKDRINSEMNLEIGKALVLNLSDGRNLIGVIIDMTDEDITVDFNHPLAGQKIILTCTLISILEEEQTS